MYESCARLYSTTFGAHTSLPLGISILTVSPKFLQVSMYFKTTLHGSSSTISPNARLFVCRTGTSRRQCEPIHQELAHAPCIERREKEVLRSGLDVLVPDAVDILLYAYRRVNYACDIGVSRRLRNELSSTQASGHEDCLSCLATSANMKCTAIREVNMTLFQIVFVRDAHADRVQNCVTPC